MNLRRRVFALTTLILMFSMRVYSERKNSADSNCIGSVFSGTLGFDAEDSASRISLVVGDNPGRWADQSSNGEPLGTRAAAPEN